MKYEIEKAIYDSFLKSGAFDASDNIVMGHTTEELPASYICIECESITPSADIPRDFGMYDFGVTVYVINQSGDSDYILQNAILKKIEAAFECIEKETYLDEDDKIFVLDLSFNADDDERDESNLGNRQQYTLTALILK